MMSSVSNRCFGRARVTRDRKVYIRTLPFDRRDVIEAREVLFVHGSPRKFNEYAYEVRPDSVLANIARVAQCDVLFFGHIHLPYQKQVGRTLSRILPTCSRRAASRRTAKRPSNCEDFLALRGCRICGHPCRGPGKLWLCDCQQPNRRVGPNRCGPGPGTGCDGRDFRRGSYLLRPFQPGLHLGLGRHPLL
jgi:hypothetical protein